MTKPDTSTHYQKQLLIDLDGFLLEIVEEIKNSLPEDIPLEHVHFVNDYNEPTRLYYWVPKTQEMLDREKREHQELLESVERRERQEFERLRTKYG